MPQVTLHLVAKEAQSLRTQDRLSRLNEEFSPAARLQLLDRGREDPVLLITGTKPEAVERARSSALLAAHKDVEGLVLPMHLHDIQLLRRTSCALLSEIEERSGCRIVLEDQRREARDDPQMGRKQPCARLLGDQTAQARAVRLLAEHCRQLVLPEDKGKITGGIRACTLQRFDPVLRGHNVELTTDHMVAQRGKNCEGCWNLSDCVVTGAGLVDLYERGAYFCLGVRRARTDRRHRGGTRVGFSNVPVVAPVPNGLVAQPRCSWVLGRGAARGPDGRSFPLPAADFDNTLQEGEELGVLVTRTSGSVAAFRKKKGEDQWQCLVHWDARIPEPHNELHLLLELAGAVEEVELLHGCTPPDAGVGFARDPVADAAAAAPAPAPAPAATAVPALLPVAAAWGLEGGEATQEPVAAATQDVEPGVAAQEPPPAELTQPPASSTGAEPAGPREDLDPTLFGQRLVEEQ